MMSFLLTLGYTYIQIGQSAKGVVLIATILYPSNRQMQKANKELAERNLTIIK